MGVIGKGGSELETRGYVTAYEADPGKQRWRFYTVPNPVKRADNAASDAIFASKGNATWSDTGEWKTSGGGGTVWDAIVYEKDIDQIYLGVGTGNQLNHGKPMNVGGDNGLLSSLVYLAADSRPNNRL